MIKSKSGNVSWPNREGRRRLGIFVAVGLLVALAALHISCATAPRRQVGEVSVAHKDREFTEFFRRGSGWVSGDGALSVPLRDGRVLWLFGDSHIDDYDPATGTTPCLFQARNAGLLQGNDDLRNPLTMVDRRPNAGRTWLKNSETGERWFWPGCGFQSGDTVYVYLSALRSTGTGGMWGFATAGRDWLAKIKFPEIDAIAYSELPEFNGICFGQGFVSEGEFIYAFGGKQRGLGSDVFVARFLSANPESAWQFWSGRGWLTNAARAAAVAHGKSTSIHVCKLRNKFLLTTSSFSIACDQGREIYMATAPGPTGPFSPLKKIYTLDDTYHGYFPFFYIPVAHPEFIDDRGELLVTYSINGYEPCVSSCVTNRAIPDHYRPKAIRVPLKLIDPEL